ncbi:MAG: ketoacyl-ACP synthase III [Bacteroidota bacterium]
MSFFSISDVKIAGITACVPDVVFRNIDYSWISLKEREEFISLSGIHEKRHAPLGITTSDLSFRAVEKLISGLGWDKNDIDLLVFVSQSRDYILPATACILQDRLGLPKTCMAFDIDMGCSAYVYALSVVCSFLSRGEIKKALMLVGDVSTQACSERDKTTWQVFGDAGTATALEHSPGSPPFFFNMQTDGKGFDAVIIPESGFRKLLSRKTFLYKKYAEGIERHKGQVVLNGTEVFKFAMREVASNIGELMKFAKKDIESIDYYVFHQAIKIINETIRRKMKLPSEKVPVTLYKYGNTSSASIPLTIVSELNKQISDGPLSLLISGFGTGLSWGSAIIHTDKIYCPDILEYDAQILSREKSNSEINFKG